MGKSVLTGIALVLATLVMLMGCEQAVMNGPVGGSVVTVTELRSGAVISENEFVTDDLDAAMARWGDDFDDFSPLLVTGVLGIAILNTLPVEEDIWYLVTMEGGFDYAGHPEQPPVQVFGTAHAILSGDQVKRGGFVVGPLSEAAYQWLRPWYETLSDAELEAALLEFTEQLVTDIRDAGEQLDYDDLLTFNPLLHTEGFIGSAAQMTAMREALAEGSSDAAKLAIAEDMVSANAPRVAAEAVFRDNISPNISQSNCIQCHVAGGRAQGTRHLLVRTSNSDHIAINVAMYANLVDALGVNRIISKPQGGAGHGGGVRLSPGSQAVADLEAFFNML